MKDRKLGTRRPSYNFRAAAAALLLLLLCCLALPVQAVPAQSKGKKSASLQAAQTRGLNNALLRLHAQMQQASVAEVAGLRRQAATVIAQRAALLQKLIASDPHAALSFAFSPELLADLEAKFPNSATQLESHVNVTGPVEHWIADYPGLRASRSWWLMKIGGGQNLNLYFSSQEPGQLKSGDFLQARGVLAGRNMAVESSTRIQAGSAFSSTSTSLSTIGNNASHAGSGGRWRASPALSATMLGMLVLPVGLRRMGNRLRTILKQVAIFGIAFAVFASSSTGGFAQTCSSTGVQNVAGLLVQFPGNPLPSNITTSNVHDMLFGSDPSLAGFYAEESYGATSVTGDVFGPFTLDSSRENCLNIPALRDAAITAAANAGIPIQNYNRILLVSSDFGCGWAGGSIDACTTLNSPNGSFVAGAAILDAAFQTSQVAGAEAAAHEIGHTMGIGHAQSRQFTSPVEPLGPLGVTGTITEYGDHLSDMGCSNIGHWAAPHKAEFLGWMSAPDYTTTSSSGTYTIAPYEVSSSGTQALRVQRGTGNAGYYLWIEYRQPIGNYDSTLWPPVQSGALIHYEDPSTGSHTQLLDFTPDTSYTTDDALLAGQTWSDPYSDLSLAVVSANSTGLTINVNYSGAVPCTAANPTVTVSPLDPSIYPGNSAAYSLTVTDNDSSGCSSSTYTLSSTQPSGWPTSFSTGSLTLSPGQSGSATMTLAAPSSALAGTYAVNVISANNSYSSSGTANVTVMSAPSLTVSVSVPLSSYTRKSTVPITATVLNGGSPATGSNVTFTLVTPSGTLTQTATSSSKGTATWNYKLGPKAPTGTYSVTAQAVLNSTGSAATQGATSNTVTFSVQ